MKTFKELGLSRDVVSILEKDKITTPTEIQEKTIPLVLAGKDVIGGSATGSGKTLAFASGIIENLKRNGKVQALILTPTRELAEQVANTITKFSEHRKLNVLPIYGGVDIGSQIRRLRDTDVVVGTPGRILDHLGRRTLNFKDIRFLVLDEVDRMFDMGFQFDVKKILKECSTKRQTMLFSATISSEMDYLANEYTKKPVKVSVESHVDPSKLKQVYYDVPDGLKFSLFVHLLKKERAGLVMVFCATRRNVDFVTKNLNNLGIKANAIHGGMLQNKRNRVLNEFNNNGGVNVLVCTDVAARGLDIQGVSHVYNYDLSKTSGEYIHRIGRTARAGKEGIAVSILCNRDYENFSNILRDEKIKIEEVKAPYIEKVDIIVSSRNRRGNAGGSRRNSFGRMRSNGPRNSGDPGGHSYDGGGSPLRGRTYGRPTSRSSMRRDYNRRGNYRGRGNVSEMYRSRMR
ncbi:MAG: DEAD/DEAH box helicase [archaeon]